MIDINLHNLTILPSNHIVFEGIDGIENLQNDNKILKQVLIISSIIILAIFVIKVKYEVDDKKNRIN